MIRVADAKRVIQLNEQVTALRGMLKEMDSLAVASVTVSAVMVDPKDRYYGKKVARKVEGGAGSDLASRVTQMIRADYQQRLDARLRELRRLDGEIIDG